jgi:16S rRNA (cytosine967-C5)-methyltransferase
MNMRQWVWNGLCEVVLHKKYSNLYLKDHLQEVDEKDQALASAIFYGTLQNYDYCKAVWKRFVTGKINARAGVLLTMSVYQLLFLDRVPAYSVIDEAVDIAKKKMPGLAKLVNAVLRNVTREQFVFPSDPIKALALKNSLPEWLVRLWISQYGPRQAFLNSAASVCTLPEYVRINPLRITEKDLKERPELKPKGMVKYERKQIFTDPLYKQGKITAQDPGSYEIAKWLDAKPGMKVLDLCAAPGTKSMAAAEMMENKGHIDSYDLHEHRARLIENDARRLHLDIVHPKFGDSTLLEFEEDGKYDRVLCDVPCSGFGILARKPDLKLNLSPKTIDELVPLQAELLETGAKALKKDGRLVYSTCTINKKENEKQIEKFLENHPEFEAEDMQTIFPSDEHDGFFMAKLRYKNTELPEQE